MTFVNGLAAPATCSRNRVEPSTTAPSTSQARRDQCLAHAFLLLRVFLRPRPLCRRIEALHPVPKARERRRAMKAGNPYEIGSALALAESNDRFGRREPSPGPASSRRRWPSRQEAASKPMEPERRAERPDSACPIAAPARDGERYAGEGGGAALPRPPPASEGSI